MGLAIPSGRRARRLLAWILAVVTALAIVGGVCFKLSPWPSVLAIRFVFSRGGAAANQALAAYVPPGILVTEGVRYVESDPDAVFDLYRPQAGEGKDLPLLMWIHGGGFVAGSRKEIANYARLLAGEGFAVAVVDYPLAPEVQYPAPVRRLTQALRYLSGHAPDLHLDSQRFLLGGDSAGAQLAAQLAALASSPDYARATGLTAGIARAQLRGVVLFCGPHDARLMAGKASNSWFLRTVMWAYLGSPAPAMETMDAFSVVPHVTSGFPPAFVTVGNADPLAPQSYALAEALREHGVPVSTLFFPPSHQPALGHEYQFDLSRPEAREALEQTRRFLHDVVGAPAAGDPKA